jgi:cellulose synthase/poly-beta-1,6-N-acetylglucosamine synthase-like glycosyltransferase
MVYSTALALFVGVSLALMVAWSFYNLPVLARGVRGRRRATPVPNPSQWPFLSAIIPARDEEAVLTRENNIVDSLAASDYPRERLEVILAVTATKDRTLEVAQAYARKYPGLVKVLSLPKPEGKPKALNEALKVSLGDVIAVFDADGFVAPHALRKAVATLLGRDAAAVQGRILSLNAGQSFVARVVAMEEKGWDNMVMEGRDELGLFVPLRGTNFYIRREVLERIGGWDPQSLAEDADLSARLHEAGYRIVYQPESILWQESPPRLSILIPQRVRWFRGYIETAFKFGRLVRKPTFRALDAEVVLTAPIIMSLAFMSYIIWVLSLVYPPLLPPLPLNPAWLSVLLTTLTLLPIGVSLAFKVKPPSARNLLYIPFIFAYWVLLTAIATYSLFLVMAKRPRIWIRTLKTGYFDRVLTK